MPVPCGGPGRARRAGVRRGAVHRLFALRAEVLRGRADDAGADRARGGGAKGMLTHAVMNRSLLIENGTLLSTGGAASLRRGHSVLIEGGVITRVAPRERMGRFSGRRVDAAGKVVIPGLINGHTHFYGAFARGLTGTKPARDFLGVLRNLWWRLDSALTTEDCYYSALVALLDSSLHGPARLPLLRGLRPRRRARHAGGAGRERPLHPTLPGGERRRPAGALRAARLVHQIGRASWQE